MNQKHKFLQLDLYRPPQLLQALGYFGEDNTPVGLWYDLDKITIDYGFGSFTSSNPGWYRFQSLNNAYFAGLRWEYDIYGNELSGELPKYGFLILEKIICLGKIPNIKTVLQQNPDPRPDWVKNATIEEAQNKDWQQRYWKWKEENMAATFPRFDPKVHQAISNMQFHIENRN